MDGLVYMDAVITPNRSLSQRGFVVLISIVTFFNCVAAGVFLADVRPAIRRYTPTKRRGGSGRGPYGSW